jgi:hypothetical protein
MIGSDTFPALGDTGGVNSMIPGPKTVGNHGPCFDLDTLNQTLKTR